jgi:ABC-type nickel/cobalt efflux system permease component RcnA
MTCRLSLSTLKSTKPSINQKRSVQTQVSEGTPMQMKKAKHRHSHSRSSGCSTLHNNSKETIRVKENNR